MSGLITRRGLLAGLGYGVIAGTTSALAYSPSFRDFALRGGEALSYRTHRLIGRNALAPEFSEAEMSPVFRTNGNTMPSSADYQRHMNGGFADWGLVVDGLVTTPRTFSLNELRSMPSRTQITRHDCVEGWSAIGKWKGVSMKTLLDAVTLMPAARYIVLHCADSFGRNPYYESIDLLDAFHPQTILAYDMNNAPLSVGHGAPIRLRVERQLGYKQAKYVMRMEAVETLSTQFGGNGGYWEDRGYHWYAGI
ncbi:MAG: molybdopterin-binding protein [Sediminimonas qiaohouensis]|uniref:Molybdopterin-binding protein n=1 Tax=Sediminimonas qiaohouensis TaxID=552061 RepID=A0A7C9HN48_9RHOB|nr:molybdopterin-dependent oxidoreductase [Sediminimonas qiaohouensis]MTJ05608.1 molybdopterin-binding protein [Sediminimonas qiaohouensis]